MTASTESTPRLMKPKEVATLVRTLRESRQWSQETLAEVAKVTARTVQRVEAGEPSDIHTRRALAIALGLKEPDFFNQRLAIPTEEEARRLQEEFERDHLILDTVEVTTGRQIALFFETATMDTSSPAEDMPETGMREFALLLDYLRDFRDCASEFSEVQKLDVHAELQQHLDAIAAAGFTVVGASRKTKLVGKDWADKTPWEATLVYLTTVAKGRELKKMAVPRRVQL